MIDTIRYYLSQIFITVGMLGYFVFFTIINLYMFRLQSGQETRELRGLLNIADLLGPTSIILIFVAILLSYLGIAGINPITLFGREIRDFGKIGLYTMGIVAILTSLPLLLEFLGIYLPFTYLDLIILVDIVLVAIYVIASAYMIYRMEPNTSKEDRIYRGIITIATSLLVYVATSILTTGFLVQRLLIVEIITITSFLAIGAGVLYTNYNIRAYQSSTQDTGEQELYTSIEQEN